MVSVERSLKLAAPRSVLVPSLTGTTSYFGIFDLAGVLEVDLRFFPVLEPDSATVDIVKAGKEKRRSRRTCSRSVRATAVALIVEWEKLSERSLGYEVTLQAVSYGKRRKSKSSCTLNFSFSWIEHLQKIIASSCLNLKIFSWNTLEYIFSAVFISSNA